MPLTAVVRHHNVIENLGELLLLLIRLGLWALSDLEKRLLVELAHLDDGRHLAQVVGQLCQLPDPSGDADWKLLATRGRYFSDGGDGGKKREGGDLKRETLGRAREERKMR